MSQYGKYNDSLYVFDEVEPEVSINTYFDKYVESGREDSKDVALVFDILRFDNMDDVLSLLESNNVTATFFVDGLFMENNRSLLENVSKKVMRLNSLVIMGVMIKYIFESSLHVLNDITKDRPKYCVAHYDKKRST